MPRATLRASAVWLRSSTTIRMDSGHLYRHLKIEILVPSPAFE